MAHVLDKPAPTGRPIGESWELVDLPRDQSEVAEGQLAGRQLTELVSAWGDELLGPVAPDGGRFPLLVKYIDAARTLSVQVHPDERAARELGGRPKNEAWLILDAEPGAKLYVGLRPGTTPEALRRALDDGTVEQLLTAIEPRPGDLVPVRPGTVHAIGGGILLAEVQQPSDTTYRLYDWGRLGLDGRPRQLHIEQSLACIDYQARAAVGQRTHDAGHFRIELVDLEGAAEHISGGAGPLVVVGLGGAGRLDDARGQTAELWRGRVVLVPHACRPATLSARGATSTPLAVMLVTFPPAR